MKLDRNDPDNNGRGKYAILNLRKLAEHEDKVRGGLPNELRYALNELHSAGILEWGEVGSSTEFFLIKLKDRHAERALYAYALAAAKFDPEWANEVAALAARSGPNHPLCKLPD